MSGKHTPGPWTAVIHDNRALIITDEKMLCGMRPWVSCAAESLGPNGEEPIYPKEERDANAYLMAASPEFFEVCELYLEHRKEENWELIIMRKAEAALAKALNREIT